MQHIRKASLALAAIALAAPWPAVAGTPSNGTTSMTVGFNGTPIPAGTDPAAGPYIWFNSVFKPSFAAGTTYPVTIYLTDCKLVLTSKGGLPLLDCPVPNARITFGPTTTKAETKYESGTNTFVTTVPASFRDNVFLTGLTIPVPGGFPAGASATFSATFRTDAPSGVTVQYQIAAAVYKQFSTDYNALAIKPTHGGPDAYPGGDQAGTPEAFAHFPKNVIGGGTGGGSGNYTGSYSATGSVVPFFNWNPPTVSPVASVSGSVRPATGSQPALPGATIELLQNGSVVQTTSSGQDGSYLFTSVPAGSYTVRASAPDYNSNTSSVFTVSSSSLTLDPIELAPQSIAFLSDHALHGKVFFSEFYWNLATTDITLTDGNNFADLMNGAYASPDHTTSYRYVGSIPEFPELGHFGGPGEPEIYVIIQEPLLSPATDTSSFSNQVGVFDQPGTHAVGTAGEYTYRFLVSMPFTGPGTAHNYTFADVQFTTGSSSTESGSIVTPISVAPTDGASVPPPPSGDVPPGFTAQAVGQITLPPSMTADVSADGSYSDVSGQVFPYSLTSSVGGGPEFVPLPQ
jgi:Carboxypeptidase regulatory-like domain